MDHRCDGRSSGGYRPEPPQPGRAACQGASDHQSGQDDQGRDHHRRVDGDGGGCDQAHEGDVRAQVPYTGSGARVAAAVPVGGDSLCDGEPVGDPGEGGVDRQGGQATLPEGVVRQRHRQVDEHRCCPRTTAADRPYQAPDAERADRKGGEHHGGPDQVVAAGQQAGQHAEQCEAVGAGGGHPGSGGPPPLPPGAHEVEGIGRQCLEPAHGRQAPGDEVAGSEAQHRGADHERRAAGAQQGAPEVVEPDLAGRFRTRAVRCPTGHGPSEGVMGTVGAGHHRRVVDPPVQCHDLPPCAQAGPALQVPEPRRQQAPHVPEAAGQEPVGDAQHGGHG